MWRGDRVLLALRSRPPNADKWATPGGGVELGETLEAAAIREIKEETGLDLERVVFNRFHEIIRIDGGGAVEGHFVLAMFVAISESGDAVAGDDAARVGWFTLEEAQQLTLTDQTMVFLEESRHFLSQLAPS